MPMHASMRWLRVDVRPAAGATDSAPIWFVSAVLMEISEDWETGKTYLTFNQQ